MINVLELKGCSNLINYPTRRFVFVTYPFLTKEFVIPNPQAYSWLLRLTKIIIHAVLCAYTIARRVHELAFMRRLNMPKIYKKTVNVPFYPRELRESIACVDYIRSIVDQLLVQSSRDLLWTTLWVFSASRGEKKYTHPGIIKFLFFHLHLYLGLLRPRQFPKPLGQ